MKRIIFIIYIILMGFLLGCSQKNNESTDTVGFKPIIGVSIAPLETITKWIVGDKCEIIVALPSGKNPYDYDINPANADNLGRVSIFFLVGVPYESDSIRPSLSNSPGIKWVNLNQKIQVKYDVIYLNNGRVDPHIWLSPHRTMMMVEIIAAELSDLDPDNSRFYAQNAAAAIDNLQLLYDNAELLLKDKKGSTFLCQHPSFNYLAKDFGINTISADELLSEGLSINDIAEIAVENGLPGIIFQSEYDTSYTHKLMDIIDGNAIPVSPLSEKYDKSFNDIVKAIADISR